MQASTSLARMRADKAAKTRSLIRNTSLSAAGIAVLAGLVAGASAAQAATTYEPTSVTTTRKAAHVTPKYEVTSVMTTRRPAQATPKYEVTSVHTTRRPAKATPKYEVTSVIIKRRPARDMTRFQVAPATTTPNTA